VKPSELPTTGRRLSYGLGALATTLVTGAGVFALVVIDDLLRPPNQLGPGVPFVAFALVVVAGALGAGAWMGLAISPVSVIQRRTRRPFVAAVALSALILVLALPSPLAVFTWPLALVLAVVASLLFRRALRPTSPP
jgi:lysylphosphatidylglycerol synthetase-like protein (DUF2156 family)